MGNSTRVNKMRSNYHRQTSTESALISGLDHKSKHPKYGHLAGQNSKGRPKTQAPQAPQKKAYKLIDGKIKEVAFKQERPPFWERPKNKNFLTLIMKGNKKKQFYKKILREKLERYNKENPHRIEPVPEWLMTPEQSYRIVEIEKDKAYKIVNRKDDTLVMDGLKTHKQAMWTLHNNMPKAQSQNNK